MTGLHRRLRRILSPTGPSFILPIDDALISGPSGSLKNPQSLLRSLAGSGISGVLGYAGTLRACLRELDGIGFILNLTGSTVHRDHTRKVLLTTVAEAVALGADCVAVHANITSQFESEALRNIGAVAGESHSLGVPLLVLAYPRREREDGLDDNYSELRGTEPEKYTSLVAHCARIAVELGADLVKVPYTGSEESFNLVVAKSLGVPVLVAGGSQASDHVAITMATDAVKAGAAGVAYGRQTFSKSPDAAAEFVAKVRAAMQQAYNVPENHTARPFVDHHPKELI